MLCPVNFGFTSCLNLPSPSPSLGIVHMSLCSLSCLTSLWCPVNFGFMPCLNLPFPVFDLGTRVHVISYCLWSLLYVLRPVNFRFWHVLILISLSIYARVCEIFFCSLEFIVHAQFCSAIFSLRRAFIFFSPKTVCNFVLLVTYIYALYPENSSFKIRFPQQLCLCLCNFMLLIVVDCMCCVMQIWVLRMVSG